MLNKIMSAYKLQSKIILSAVAMVIVMFLFQLDTYIKYRNVNFDKMLSVETQEFFFFFYFSIFIAVLFNNNFKFFMAVGASRKSIFISNILMYFSIAPILAFANIAIYKAFHNYARFESMYLSVFNKRYENSIISEKTVMLEYFFWQVTVFLAVALFMYSIKQLLYRLNKKGKIVCISLLAVIPIAVSSAIGLIYNSTKSPFINHILNIVKYLAGDGKYPIRASLINIIFATIFGFIGYRIIRRTPLK